MSKRPLVNPKRWATTASDDAERHRSTFFASLDACERFCKKRIASNTDVVRPQINLLALRVDETVANGP